MTNLQFERILSKFLSMNGIDIAIVINSWLKQCVIDLTKLKLLHAYNYCVI